MRRVLLLVITLCSAVALVGCSSAPKYSADETAIRSLIPRYDAMLIEGYRALNMNGMAQVATKLQAEDEYIFMSSLAEGGVRLDAELKDIQFIDVSVETTSATAETKETWDYRHYNRTTGKLVREQKGLVYSLAWDLEKQPDGTWLVSDMRAVSATASAAPTEIGTVTPSLPSGP